MVGKLLEGILRVGINQYLERQGLIQDSQHRSVCAISCLTNLTEFFEVVTKRSDDVGWQTSGLKQSIGRLDQKVRSHGVQSKLTNWIQNWLSDWSRRMVEEGSFSD